MLSEMVPASSLTLHGNIGSLSSFRVFPKIIQYCWTWLLPILLSIFTNETLLLKSLFLTCYLLCHNTELEEGKIPCSLLLIIENNVENIQPKILRICHTSCSLCVVTEVLGPTFSHCWLFPTPGFSFCLFAWVSTWTSVHGSIYLKAVMIVVITPRTCDLCIA